MPDVDEALLKLMEIYRHDFLNSLQVVGGLAQMNKTERLLDFIRKTSEEVQQFGRLAACGDPRLALLIHESLCQDQQFSVVLEMRGKTRYLPQEVLTGLKNILSGFSGRLSATACSILTVSLDAGLRLGLRVTGEIPPDFWPQIVALCQCSHIPQELDAGENELQLLLDKL